MERAKQITDDAEGATGVVTESGRRMTQLLGMFQNQEGQREFVIDNKVEVEDWGNVEAIRAGIRDPKKIQEYMENLKKGRP